MTAFLARMRGHRPGPRQRPPTLFDADFYRRSNPDVQGSDLDAWEHYRTIGAGQNRQPRADFDPLHYAATHADVIAGGIDPFLHYVRHGHAEGRAAVPPPPPSPRPARHQLRNIVIGGSNVCNASCVHCPTNKPHTDKLERGAMSQGTFERIVDQIHERCDVNGWAGFGLFGDGLVDPLIVERASYFKSKLPHVMLSVATNGAAYSRLKHARLPEILDGITLHVEAVNPATYNRLMAPLRFETVSVKLEQIVEDFRGKVFVAAPWHRENDDQRQEIADYFVSRGVREMNFVGLSNRCSMRREFDRLAFAPIPHPCGTDIFSDLVLDWDGSVLACCNDFEKLHPVGNLTTATIDEVLTSAERRAFQDRLAKGQWDRLPTCATCSWDSHGGYRVTRL